MACSGLKGWMVETRQVALMEAMAKAAAALQDLFPDVL